MMIQKYSEINDKLYVLTILEKTKENIDLYDKKKNQNYKRMIEPKIFEIWQKRSNNIYKIKFIKDPNKLSKHFKILYRKI